MSHVLLQGPGRVVGIATGYGLDGPGSNPGGARFSTTVQSGPGDHPAPYTVGIGPFPGVKSGRGVTLTPHPLRVPWSRKNTAIPLLLLWALQPVQYSYTSTPPMGLTACTEPQCLYKGALYFLPYISDITEYKYKSPSKGNQEFAHLSTHNDLCFHANSCTKPPSETHFVCSVNKKITTVLRNAA